MIHATVNRPLLRRAIPISLTNFRWRRCCRGLYELPIAASIAIRHIQHKFVTDILTERRGAALWLTLNRPERRNALNDSIILTLEQAIREVSADRDIRAIVLTGAGGKVFCAGGDLKAAADKDGSPFDTNPLQSDNPLIALFKAVVSAR